MEGNMLRLFKNIWKLKAVKNSKENKKLRKRIKELEDSRNSWRKKADNFKNKIKDMEIELKKN
jgi:predicted  nucleic acid-binding Zn-ribbon protein